MSVFRLEKNRDYTVMSNIHLKDTQLSLKSKGLLSMMLSLPDEWDYSERGLAAICKEGVDAIHSAIKELERAGYIERHQLRDLFGRLSDVEYVIYERPHLPSPDTPPPHTENPDTVEPRMDLPCPKKPEQLNTYQSSTNKSNTNESSTQSISPPAPSRALRQSESSGLTERRITADEIREQIEYEIVCEQFSREQVDEVVSIIEEVQNQREGKIQLSQRNSFDASFVKERFSRVGRDHVEMVLDALKEITGGVKNMHSYLLTALFNSVSTLEHYYQARVNHDLYGG